MAERDPVAALRELVEAAERFSAEASYSVPVSTEEDFVAALEDARATLEALESGEREQPRISITYDRASSMYVIGDEDGEFARASAWTDTWRYITDLLTGPGTLSAGSLFDRTINQGEPMECPRCHSPKPHLHPAVQVEGEVSPCPHQFHTRVTPENTPERIAKTQELLPDTQGADNAE